MKYIVTTLALALVLSASAVAGAQALIGSSQIANRSIRLVDFSPVRGQGAPGEAGSSRASGRTRSKRTPGSAGPGRCQRRLRSEQAHLRNGSEHHDPR